MGRDGAIEDSTTGTVDLAEGLEVFVMFEYHATPDDGEPPSTTEPDEDDTLHVFAAFTLQYEYVERNPGLFANVNASSVAAFAEFNATLNAWPYWREFLQSTTTRMGLPPVTVRTLPVPNLAAPATDFPDSDNEK